MDNFFFVEIDNLTSIENLPEDARRPIAKEMEGWIDGSAFLCLCTKGATSGSVNQYVAITNDKLYFFDFVMGSSVQVSKVKSFHKRGVVAHAFMMEAKEQPAQIRVMMDNALKLRFGLSGPADESRALLKRIATCPFFT